MNFKTAAIVAGAAFVLSLFMGVLGGVPWVDIFVRAVFWAAFGFGATLGVEKLLRMMVPELFAAEPEAPDEGIDRSTPEPEGAARMVDIVVEDEGPPRYRADVDEPASDRAPGEALGPGETSRGGPEPAPAGDAEDMPEIGSFLDAFKPGGPEVSEGAEGSEAGPAPEIGEYSPQSSDSLARADEVTIDGEAQDPAILAKAVQTVMKRDGQGT